MKAGRCQQRAINMLRYSRSGEIFRLKIVRVVASTAATTKGDGFRLSEQLPSAL